MNGHENIDPNINFFRIKTGKRTNGRDLTLLEKGHSRMDVRKYSFSKSTVNDWNKLSADCVHYSSINMAHFKLRLNWYRSTQIQCIMASSTVGPILR